MVKITIVGAGYRHPQPPDKALRSHISSIAGMSIASQLPKGHEITIVARDLPGDPESLGWASPWAGAVWMGMDGSPPREQKMQLDAFAHMWKLAMTNPESSVKRIEMHDLTDFKKPEDVWYYGKMPGLEAAGVVFKRVSVRSLADLKGMGHDILINATGWGSRFLRDVSDQDVEQVRGQTVLVKSDYDKIWIRRGQDYTYVLPRGDGTAILGGIKQFGDTNALVDSGLRADIFRRVHENLPEAFPDTPSGFQVVRDIVGIRPQRKTGARVEKEILNGRTVIHAYGAPGGGYVYSYGIAREVAELVNDIQLKMPKANL
ncbi:hypothetical protein SLS56_008329 [Neofusicoccum ribis]|uniref:FAD dependent oxidoreductase domain-containing protein n=1 Tax=Neofusicoccum ribis TaxID=45134 RepID=A0ABR3SKF3_9PEZI